MNYAITGPNFPWGAREMVNKLLADPRTTTSHIMHTADHLDAIAAELPPSSHYITSMRGVAAELRKLAPQYHHSRGNPNGDFDGSLAPPKASSETFICAVCGGAIDTDQYDQWGGAEMCKPCAQSCEENAAACVHTWEPYDGGAFCTKCATVTETGDPT